MEFWSWPGQRHSFIYHIKKNYKSAGSLQNKKKTLIVEILKLIAGSGALHFNHNLILSDSSTEYNLVNS